MNRRAPDTQPAIAFSRDVLSDFAAVTRREWLVTNGIGGFAAGTICGTNTRRYHGLLIASLQPPVQRTAMVAKLDATAIYRGRRYELATNEFGDGTISPHGYAHLDAFLLDGQNPKWTWLIEDALLEQRVWMAHGSNTTYVSFRLVRAAEPLELELSPLCTYRDFHAQHRGHRDTLVTPVAGGVKVDSFYGAVPFRLLSDRGTWDIAPEWYWNFRHREERERGLDDIEDLVRPARLRITLEPNETAAFIATAEAHEPVDAKASLALERRRQQALLELPAARSLLETTADDGASISQLILAADQFIVTCTISADDGRPTAAPQRAIGARASDPEPTAYSLQSEQSHTVIAGYPWFSDWGRDTMIALPGLTLTTGRYDVAANILRTFARYVSDGMLPNLFPDSGNAPEYNTVDATLWYLVAIDEYMRRTNDRALLDELYPTLRSIVRWHQRGTRYGIGVDAADGLLRAGEPGVQLTWMDAKIGDWVVTPRIGKPVEINALWANALAIMRDFSSQLGDAEAKREYASAADRVVHSFRERFWFADGGYLYDVIDSPEGDDTSLRPNQVFAVSLRHGLLDHARAKSVVDVCARELWTPVGLRSLGKLRSGAGHWALGTGQNRGDARAQHTSRADLLPEPNAQCPAPERRYAGRYVGGPRDRDAVYHQGTAWSWLLGPFVAAHYRVYEDAPRARAYLDGIASHLRDACVGQVSEIFDGDAPFTPRGCFAQAWGVAEVLRVLGDLHESEVSEIRREARRSSAAL